MVFKINKFFFEISTPFKLIFINILLVSIIFLFSKPVFSNISNIERNLAYKYCDSIEQNLFKGLDNERILKYEYFFNSINAEELNEESKKLNNFASEVETTCSYKLSIGEIKDIERMLDRFYLKAKK